MEVQCAYWSTQVSVIQYSNFRLVRFLRNPHNLSALSRDGQVHYLCAYIQIQRMFEPEVQILKFCKHLVLDCCKETSVVFADRHRTVSSPRAPTNETDHSLNASLENSWKARQDVDNTKSGAAINSGSRISSVNHCE
jgi:hypothetical protein